jgi:hypothetical protein
MKECALVKNVVFERAYMKVLLVLLTWFFSTGILLIAGFQFIRLFVNKLTEIALAAWRSPEIPSSD